MSSIGQRCLVHVEHYSPGLSRISKSCAMALPAGQLKRSYSTAPEEDIRFLEEVCEGPLDEPGRKRVATLAVKFGVPQKQAGRM